MRFWSRADKGVPVSDSRSLIGDPGTIDAAEVRAFVQGSTALWMNNYGVPPADLVGDISKMRTWFDPVAQGFRLRRELGALPPLDADVPNLGDPWSLEVGQERVLLTPEGRCRLDLLVQVCTGGLEAWSLTDPSLAQYDRLLAETYRAWSRHRLNGVVSLLAGTTKPLQIPAAGVLVALLVNRCTNEARALPRYAKSTAREAIDAAFFAPVREFEDALAPRRRGDRDNPALVTGWMLSEVRRRLGDALVVLDGSAGHDGKLWISDVVAAIEVIARDLARGHRRRVTPTMFAGAFDALVNRLRDDLPVLANLGLAHETQFETDALRRTLLDRLSSYVNE